MYADYIERKRDARALIKASLADPTKRLLACVMIYLTCTYLLSVLMSRMSGYSDYVTSLYRAVSNNIDPMTVAYPAVKPAAAVLAALIFIMSLVMETGFISYSLRLTRGWDVQIRCLFDGFSVLHKAACIRIIQTLLCFAGYMLFIVPGLWFNYRYRFAIHIMFDHPEYSPIRCLRESARMTHGKRFTLFTIDLSFLGWILLNEMVTALFFPILDLWVTPYYGFTFAMIYNDLSSASVGAAAAPADTQRTEDNP